MLRLGSGELKVAADAYTSAGGEFLRWLYTQNAHFDVLDLNIIT